MKINQTSWIYRIMASVTPRRAGWIFCGSALLTIILIFISIYGNNINHTYSDLAMVMLLLTLLAGTFGLLSWLIERYVKDEESKIQARYGLYSGVVFYLFIMVLTILQKSH